MVMCILQSTVHKDYPSLALKLYNRHQGWEDDFLNNLTETPSWPPKNCSSISVGPSFGRN